MCYTSCVTQSRYTPAELLDDFSLEMTGKDVPGLIDASSFIPKGTRVNVTFLGNEDLGMRLRAAKEAFDRGFIPVPHISARRLETEQQLTEFLGALNAQGTSEHLFSVGGDPEAPAGPFGSSLELIESGLLPEYGAKDISIAGYPEGHPGIREDLLWDALRNKHRSLTAQGLTGTILTQFGFDVDPVVEWIERVRAMDIDYEIRVGVPGPAGIKRLLSFAARFGVASSAGIAKKYGLSLTNLMSTAGPDRFISTLAQRLESEAHGVVKVHFYTFGGLAATAKWIREFEGER